LEFRRGLFRSRTVVLIHGAVNQHDGLAASFVAVVDAEAALREDRQGCSLGSGLAASLGREGRANLTGREPFPDLSGTRAWEDAPDLDEPRNREAAMGGVLLAKPRP